MKITTANCSAEFSDGTCVVDENETIHTKSDRSTHLSMLR